MPYRLPTPAEREVIFAWLIRASSLTYWEYLFELHVRFVAIVEKAFEQTQRELSATERPYIATDRMTQILSSHAAFRAALDRLRRADRSCFKFLGASGHFVEGVKAVTWWKEMFEQDFSMGGPEFRPTRSSFWPQIEREMDACNKVYGDLSVVVESRFMDKPAPIDNIDAYYPTRGTTMFKTLVQETRLPHVPVPTSAILVRTGEPVPHYGIWEPSVIVAKTGDIVIDGCMNYLHASSPAPTIGFPEDNQRNKGRPTIWRLIFADTRYGANPVPPEEATYVR